MDGATVFPNENLGVLSKEHIVAVQPGELKKVSAPGRKYVAGVSAVHVVKCCF